MTNGVDLSTVLNSTDRVLYRSATMRLCYLELATPTKRTGTLDASTDSWKPGCAQKTTDSGI